MAIVPFHDLPNVRESRNESIKNLHMIANASLRSHSLIPSRQKSIRNQALDFSLALFAWIILNFQESLSKKPKNFRYLEKFGK